MNEQAKFSAKPRTIQGKKVSQLRRVGLVPANVHGNVDKSVDISVENHPFVKLFRQVGETGLINLSVEGESATRPVLIDDVQYNPVTGDLLHVVFKQVNLKVKIEAEIPVHVVGEFNIPDSVLVNVHDEITVEALPADLPDAFTIDVSGFTQIGDMITFAQLPYDKSKITLMISEEEMDSPIVMLQEVKEEVVDEVAAPAEGEAAAEGAATPTEGAEPAADAKAE